MRFWILCLTLLVWPLAGMTQDTALRSLDTSDSGRGWDAVGRLDIGGASFCTGSLIAPDLVLTAAHCLFDRHSGAPVQVDTIEFLAGWRNGRASAYRYVKRAVVHPDYVHGGAVTAERVRNDVALLELQRPIRNTTVIPFETASRPRRGAQIGVVSYARERSEAPALQEVCDVMARQQGVLVMSCDVDFGSSGAPVFDFEGGAPRIVSVVSAKAEVEGQRVALGAQLDTPLARLQQDLAVGLGRTSQAPTTINRITVGSTNRNNTGAKFVRPGG